MKQAYRKLAKQHHPDVSKAPAEQAELQFLTIQQAYERILGKGKNGAETGPGQAGGWDFHDW